MATIREQVNDALTATGEQPSDLRYFVQLCHRGDSSWSDEHSCEPPVEVAFDALPDFKYDSGFGGVEGPPFIAFSEKYVYISVEYDGAESIEAVPRSPEHLPAQLVWYG